MVLSLSTDTTSGMSVLPPAFVLGSSGGDVAGRFDPCAVTTCGTSVFPPALVLGSSGGSSALLLAGVAEEVDIGIALDAVARVAVDLEIAGGGAPAAGAGVGSMPPDSRPGDALARFAALSSLARCSSVFSWLGGNAVNAAVVVVAGVVELVAVGGLVDAGGIDVGGIVAGGIITGIGSSGRVDASGGGSAGGGIGGLASGTSPPAAGGGTLPEALVILCMALSILALPSSDSVMASCIRFLHCLVCPALVAVPFTTARHPGQPGVAPCSSTSCRYIFQSLVKCSDRDCGCGTVWSSAGADAACFFE